MDDNPIRDDNDELDPDAIDDALEDVVEDEEVVPKGKFEDPALESLEDLAEEEDEEEELDLMDDEDEF